MCKPNRTCCGRSNHEWTDDQGGRRIREFLRLASADADGGWRVYVRMYVGFLWVHVESFLHSVASPFHSFVTTHVCIYDSIAVSRRTLASDNRLDDRFISQRHVLVQAAVTTQLCHHTCDLPQRQRCEPHMAHSAGTPRQAPNTAT